LAIYQTIPPVPASLPAICQSVIEKNEVFSFTNVCGEAFASDRLRMSFDIPDSVWRINFVSFIHHPEIALCGLKNQIFALKYVYYITVKDTLVREVKALMEK